MDKKSMKINSVHFSTIFCVNDSYRGGRDEKIIFNNTKKEKAYLAFFNASLITESQSLASSQTSFRSVWALSCASNIGKDL